MFQSFNQGNVICSKSPTYIHESLSNEKPSVCAMWTRLMKHSTYYVEDFTILNGLASGSLRRTFATAQEDLIIRRNIFYSCSTACMSSLRRIYILRNGFKKFEVFEDKYTYIYYPGKN